MPVLTEGGMREDFAAELERLARRAKGKSKGRVKPQRSMFRPQSQARILALMKKLNLDAGAPPSRRKRRRSAARKPRQQAIAMVRAGLMWAPLIFPTAQIMPA